MKKQSPVGRIWRLDANEQESLLLRLFLRYGAVLCGRGFFLLSVFLFSRFTALTAATVWKQIKLGIQWLLLQAVIVPLSVIILNKLLVKEKQNDRS